MFNKILAPIMILMGAALVVWALYTAYSLIVK